MTITIEQLPGAERIVMSLGKTIENIKPQFWFLAH